MEQSQNDNNLIQKRMPHDIDAEQAVLSSIFMDRDAAAEAFEILKSEDFYSPENKAVFEAAFELYTKGTPIDVVTVKNKLEEMNVFNEIGGVETLANIVGAVGSSVNVRNYAKIVEEKSVLRRLIKLSGNISEMSYKGAENINHILDNAEQGIFNIMEGRSSSGIFHIKDVAVSAFERIEDIYKNKGKLTGVPSGFADFDAKTAGLQPSDLILLAARPSMGKTAFALNIAQNAAIRANVPVAIFSLEMSKEQLVNRMLCSEAMIDAQKLRTGELNEDDWPKLIQAIGPLSLGGLYILTIHRAFRLWI